MDAELIRRMSQLFLGDSVPKILITGFEPFDGFTVNPSEEVAKLLDDTRVNEYSIISLVLPLDYKRAMNILDVALNKHKPDYILCLGQANRASISIERLAVNAISTKRPDNHENIPESDVIDYDGPVAYFANIDPLPLVQALLDNGIPAHTSYHAGIYGCNWLLYNVMDWIENSAPDVKATFIHLPPLPIQAIEKDMMSLATMPLDFQMNAMEIIIKNLT
ncbi:MAG: pyroglutamyl-peptidase I [Candidatus Thorarchaeota archaeon]